MNRASYLRDMGADGFGSSIVIALAALLWLVYLVPTWFRRREYLSTERNAVRLQQTLRIMAETAEVPQQVRVETSARSAAAQEKLLRAQLQREKAIARAQLAAADRASTRQLVEKLPALAAEVARGSTASRRLRRSRALTSLVLLSSFVAAGFGVSQLLVAGSWLLLASASVVAVGSFAMLGQMAAVSRARAELARGMRVRPQRVRTSLPVQEAVPETQQESGWTPVPVPKPLYLSRPQVDRAVEASLDAAAVLREAAATAERRLREAQESPKVTPIIRPAAAAPAPVAAPPSRFARMGYLDGIEGGTTDLDAVLQRRRASAAG